MKINSSYKLHEIAGEKMLVMKGVAGADLPKLLFANHQFFVLNLKNLKNFPITKLQL